MGTSARRLIIAMDGSKYADQVFDSVPFNDPSFISKLANEEEVEIVKLLKSYQAKLNDAKQEHANLKGSVQRLSGRKPGQMIVEQASGQSIDLILTGARGTSSLKTSLVGGVALYIMQNSRVPVLIVRHNE